MRPKYLGGFSAVVAYQCAMRFKQRLIITGLIVPALPLVICSVPWAHAILDASLNVYPWAHVTLEASLNLLWAMLAVTTFLHWVAPNRRKCRTHWAGLVSLIFVLALLFPLISANDDLAQLDLINDAHTSQAITTSLKSDKHPADWAGVLALPATSNSVTGFCFPLASESVSEPAHAASVVAPGDTTGNHSPPLC
jgi:hypothetical protein